MHATTAQKISISLRILILLLLLCGCQQQLMPTPNLYLQDGQAAVYSNVPQALRTPHIDVLYVTDRKPYYSGDKLLRYGHERSGSLAYGLCRLNVGKDLTWDTLVKQSINKRSSNLPVHVSSINEFGRFPATPIPIVKFEDGYIDDPEVLQKEHKAKDELRDQIVDMLAKSSHKDVFLYVHGYNNNFNEAALTIGQLWHFMGRQGVPVSYSWPAGLGGLRGYLHDRESGEFTGHHLKQCLRTIASVPSLNEVHIIAHSRGTDVITTALRELKIELDGAGKDPRKHLKLGQLVLAAPDLDFQVVQQKIAAERVHLLPRQLTIYLSKKDLAIALAEWMFSSIIRIGLLQFDDLNESQRHAIAMMPDLQFIDAQVSSGFIGHSYFHSNPAVSSDLILLLRDNLQPGEMHNRPLIRKGMNFWVIKDGYPYTKK